MLWKVYSPMDFSSVPDQSTFLPQTVDSPSVSVKNYIQDMFGLTFFNLIFFFFYEPHTDIIIIYSDL